MLITEQIDKAILAHATWKTRLKEAIESGKSEFSPSTVGQDNQCEFGKWLFNDVENAIRATPQYAAIVKKHAEFHKEAGRILQLALSGQKDAALQAMSLSSEYNRLSASLTVELKSWREKLK